MRFHCVRLITRQFSKNPNHYVFGILGLLFGLFSCIFALIYVEDEKSYDSYHENLERLYRITTEVTTAGSIQRYAVATEPLGLRLKSEYPEIEAVVRMQPREKTVLRINEKEFIERRIYNADSNIFKVFTYQFIEGDPTSALSGKNSIVIVESLAKKLFGDSESVVGQLVKVDNKDYQITAVLKNIPANSDVIFDALISLQPQEEDWLNMGYFTFVMFNQSWLNSTMSTVNDVFAPRFKKISDDFIAPIFRQGNMDISVSFHLQPLKGVHFDSSFEADTPKGNASNSYFVVILGILLLSLSCINYLNISLASASRRLMEFAVKKVLGATSKQLSTELLLEFVVVLVFSIILFYGLSFITLPAFNSITHKGIELAHLFSLELVGIVFGVMAFCIVIAGLYPALASSLVNPVEALKGGFKFESKPVLRQSMIFLQSFIAVSVITMSLIMFRQLNYVKSKDWGMDLNKVVGIHLPLEVENLGVKVNTLKSALRSQPAIQAVTSSGYTIPVIGAGNGSVKVDTDKGKMTLVVNKITTDQGYIDLFNISLLMGKNFPESESSHQRVFIVNEQFLTLVNWNRDESVIGRKIVDEQEGQVIGVLKDFHYESLHNKIEPIVLSYDPDNANVVFVKTNELAIANVRKIWDEVFPGEMFDYFWLDNTVKTIYAGDDDFVGLAYIIAAICILLSAFGVFGIASLIAQGRLREMGIRKVIGAEAGHVFMLFYRDFFIPVSLSFAVSGVLVWYLFADKWLENFAYHIDLTITPFIISYILVLLVVLAVTMSSVLKVILVNPIRVIRRD